MKTYCRIGKVGDISIVNDNTVLDVLNKYAPKASALDHTDFGVFYALRSKVFCRFTYLLNHGGKLNDRAKYE